MIETERILSLNPFFFFHFWGRLSAYWAVINYKIEESVLKLKWEFIPISANSTIQSPGERVPAKTLCW